MKTCSLLSFLQTIEAVRWPTEEINRGLFQQSFTIGGVLNLLYCNFMLEGYQRIAVRYCPAFQTDTLCGMNLDYV